jgi:hypothetical protein
LILHAVGRILLVPIAFLLGIAAAVWVLFTLGLEVTTQTVARQANDADKIGVLIDLGFGFLRVFAAASILPALLVVIVGEVARIRSVLYYVLGGGLALAMFPLLARIGTTLPDASGSVPIRAWAVLSTAGFAGGLVYWVIAGRRA